MVQIRKLDFARNAVFLLLLTFLSLCGLPRTVSAGPLEEGLDAMDRKDFTRAEELFLQASKEGDPEAQYRLGMLLASGDSGPLNTDSMNWLQRSAEGGYVEAQKFLGAYYAADSDGYEQSQEQAFYWYLEAAKLGDPLAQQIVAGLYNIGRGVEMDETKADFWFARAAENEMPWSQYYLAQKLLEHPSIENNVSDALDLLARASENGFIDADLLLGQLYSEAKVMPSVPTEAYRWYSRAAQTGLPLARLRQAEMLIHGRGTPLDCNAGLDLLKMSAESGFPEAQFYLGSLFANAECVERDLTKTYFWWTLAARGDLQEAVEQLKKLEAGMAPEEFALLQKALEESPLEPESLSNLGGISTQ
ncbi:hypothetical protein JCM30471_17670 [Desulfuromonas carbonis]